MHTTIQLLDEISKKYDGASDYRIGKMLNVSGSAVVSSWRKGRSSLSQDFALKVAALLEWDPAYVIACVERERAVKDSRLEQTDEIAATWQKIADRFRPVIPGLGFIMVAALAYTAGGFSSSNQALARMAQSAPEFTAVYIMRACSSDQRKHFGHIPRWLSLDAALYSGRN